MDNIEAIKEVINGLRDEIIDEQFPGSFISQKEAIRRHKDKLREEGRLESTPPEKIFAEALRGG